jgi:hypothetical protein
MSDAKKPMTEAKKKGPSLFAVITLIAGVIAIGLLLWRISKAWRIEYGGAPREPPGIPTGGSFGPPGGTALPQGSGTGAATAAPSST